VHRGATCCNDFGCGERWHGRHYRKVLAKSVANRKTTQRPIKLKTPLIPDETILVLNLKFSKTHPNVTMRDYKKNFEEPAETMARAIFNSSMFSRQAVPDTIIGLLTNCVKS